MSSPETLTPDAPPPPDAQASAMPLEQPKPPATWLAHRLASITKAAASLERGWLHDMQHRLLDPYLRMLEQVTRRHAQLMAQLPTEVPRAPKQQWKHAFDYHVAVRADVIEPIARHLHRTRPAAMLGQSFRQRLERLAALTDGVPETATFPEPDNLYATERFDTAGERLR